VTVALSDPQITLLNSDDSTPAEEVAYRDDCPPIEALSRRELISTTLFAAMLIACKDGRRADVGQETPRQLQDVFGPVTLPARPQRIIAGEDVTLNNLLALGVQPVGGFIYADSGIRHTAHLLDKQYVDLRKAGALDLEKALTLKPDLLVALGGTREKPRNAESCAVWKQALPTFCYEYDFTYEEQIKNNVLELGRALNLDEEARAVIARFDQRVADLRQKVVAAGFNDKPVSVVRVFDANSYALRTGTLESMIFRAIGIPRPAGQQDPTRTQVDFSAENLNVLNEAYALVVYADDDDYRGGQARVTETMIRTHPLWQGLTPVRAGRVVFVQPWNGADILKAMTIMDEIEEHILPLAGRHTGG
jgi:iron complex transport system substrate-binding protein